MLREKANFLVYVAPAHAVPRNLERTNLLRLRTTVFADAAAPRVDTWFCFWNDSTLGFVICRSFLFTIVERQKKSIYRDFLFLSFFAYLLLFFIFSFTKWGTDLKLSQVFISYVWRHPNVSHLNSDIRFLFFLIVLTSFWTSFLRVHSSVLVRPFYL